MPSALLAVQENALSSVFVWSLVLVAAIIGGFWLVTLLKRRLKDTDEPPSLGFSLADLRALHRSGQLSDEEFERARTKMAASLKRDLQSKPAARPGRDGMGPGGGEKRT